MKKIIITTFLSFIILINVRSQDLTFFDIPLNSGKVTLCEAIEKYGTNGNGNDDFKYGKIGKRMHSLVFKYEHKIFKNNAFVLFRDSINFSEFSLNQIGLSSREYLITEKNFNKLLKETNKVLKQLEDKYGSPSKIENLTDRYYGEENDKIPGKIIKATWETNNVKLQIEFAKDGPPGHHFYSLKIHKFQDYIGNMKIPKGWKY